MKLHLTISSPSGGSVSTDIEHTNQILYDLGLDEQDIDNLCEGGAVAIPVPNPNQLDLGAHLFDMCAKINQMYSAPLLGNVSDERHEAHR